MRVARFNSEYGIVTLTGERRRHIIEFHPDVANCFGHFAATLARPEYETRSAHDASVVILYRFLPMRKRYLAIVVKKGNHTFILTAYLAKKPRPSIL